MSSSHISTLRINPLRCKTTAATQDPHLLRLLLKVRGAIDDVTNCRVLVQLRQERLRTLVAANLHFAEGA